MTSNDACDSPGDNQPFGSYNLDRPYGQCGVGFSDAIETVNRYSVRTPEWPRPNCTASPEQFNHSALSLPVTTILAIR
jgi:hypothetical protein